MHLHLSPLLLPSAPRDKTEESGDLNLLNMAGIKNEGEVTSNSEKTLKFDLPSGLVILLEGVPISSIFCISCAKRKSLYFYSPLIWSINCYLRLLLWLDSEMSLRNRILSLWASFFDPRHRCFIFYTSVFSATK